MDGTRLSTYRIVTELGAGGMGKVYRAEVEGDAGALEPGRSVALKVVHPHLLESPGFLERFLREAEIGRRVHHENVVRTYDCDAATDGGVEQSFLVMEYVEGQTLRDLLQELERVPEELCRHIAREVAKGLSAIHDAGVVHRDIKPENVLITQANEVKIMDLGVAHLQEEVIRLSQAGHFIGSIEYAAPEQLQSQGASIDGRVDLFALGLMLYELSTGQNPFRDEDVRKVLRNVLEHEPRRLGVLNPQVSPFFEEVVHTLLAKDRTHRFEDARALLAVLEEGQAGAWWTARAQAIRAETQRPLRRIHVPRETALHGRERELEALRRHYERAAEGEGQVVLIEGEAGIGKTRLVDEFVASLREDGADVPFLFGAYPPGGAATAAGAFSTAYREHLGDAALEKTLDGYLDATPLLVPAFAALLRGDSAPSDAAPLTKDSLQMTFVRVTQQLAAEQPTILLIDDLHFAPSDGLALFACLAGAIRDHRMLLIGTAREGLSRDWIVDLERGTNLARLPLPRLGAKDLIELLTDTFRSERLATELGAEIALKSDGNPFFTFEIVKDLREGRLITQERDGTWIRTQVIEGIEIPSSVMDLIRGRLADLSEDERDLLEVASCCGFDFDPLLVGEALGVAQIPVMKRLARIEAQHRLVRSSGRRFVFDHHQVQEALYQGMPELLREPYHQKLAETLEQRTPTATGAVAVELCEHALAGRDGPRVARHLAAAMKHLAEGYLHDDAIALGQRALRIPGLLEGPDRVEVLLRIAASLELRGRHEEDRAALEEAHTIAAELEDPERLARVQMHFGRLGIWLGDLDEAAARLEEARRYAVEAGSVALEGTALGNLGIVHYRNLAYDEAEPLFELALERAASRDDRRGMAVGTLNLGNVFWCRGQYDRARQHYERYHALSGAIGYREGIALAVGNLGNVELALGRTAPALERYQEVLDMAAAIGDRRKTALFATTLSNLQLLLGWIQRARASAEGALALAGEIGLRQEEATAHLALADLDEEQGALESAARHAEEAHALYDAIGSDEGRVRASLALARIALADGNTDRARDALAQARASADPRTQPVNALWVALFAARLPDGGADRDEASRRYDELADTLSVHVRMQAAEALHRATGEARFAREAVQCLDRLVASAPSDAAETIEKVRLHARIRSLDVPGV